RRKPLTIDCENFVECCPRFTAAIAFNQEPHTVKGQRGESRRIVIDVCCSAQEGRSFRLLAVHFCNCRHQPGQSPALFPLLERMSGSRRRRVLESKYPVGKLIAG